MADETSASASKASAKMQKINLNTTYCPADGSAPVGPGEVELPLDEAKAVIAKNLAVAVI